MIYTYRNPAIDAGQFGSSLLYASADCLHTKRQRVAAFHLRLLTTALSPLSWAFSVAFRATTLLEGFQVCPVKPVD